MFRAELLKIRSLPTPRYALTGTALILLLSCVVLLIVSPDRGDSSWHGVPLAVVGALNLLVPIVLGAWVIGLEFSSKTIRLAATVQPDRARLLARKLAAAVLLISAFATVTLALMFVGEAVMAGVGGSTPDYGNDLRTAASLFVNAVLWGLFAFGLVLVFRSYTGALVGALAMRFVLDTPIALRLIPTVGDYTFGSGADSLMSLISGDPADLTVAVSIITAAAWLAAINGLGAARFVIQDLK